MDQDADGNYLIVGSSYFIGDSYSTFSSYNCKMVCPYVLIQQNDAYSFMFFLMIQIMGLFRCVFPTIILIIHQQVAFYLKMIGLLMNFDIRKTVMLI